MKILAVFLLLLNAPLLFCGQKILVAGSGWNRIMLLDRDTGKSDWSYEIPGHFECNGAVLTADKKIFYANKKNARLIGADGRQLWEYSASDVQGNREEIHTALELKNGALMLGICGKPARIVELSKKGGVLNEISFDTGIENIHGQFRQVGITKRNTYIVSLMERKTALELDRKGRVLRRVQLSFSPFSTKELPNGNWLLSGGGGNIQEIDPSSGEIVRKITSKSIGGVELLYPTEAKMLPNSNIMVANWNGHSKDKSQPMLLEFDRDNRLVWALKSDEEIKNISAFQTLGK